jgi:ribonuclease VapC
MIVIDSSALIAILEHEPERTAFFQAIASADRCLVSAVSYQETGQVIFSRSDFTPSPNASSRRRRLNSRSS